MPATLGATFFTAVAALGSRVCRGGYRIEKLSIIANAGGAKHGWHWPMRAGLVQYRRYSKDAVPLRLPELSINGLWRIRLP